MGILTNYLKGIADAIRAKKGTTGSINAQNFANEITTIVSEEYEKFIKGELTEIVIPEGVTTLRKNLLNGYSKGVNLYIPSSLLSFGYVYGDSMGSGPSGECKYIFNEEWNNVRNKVSTNNLSNQPLHKIMTKENGIDTILEEITINANSNDKYTNFYNNLGIKKVFIDKNYGYGSAYTYKFSSCTNLEEVNFGNNITQIPNGFLQSVYNLNYIKIPSNITKIGSNALQIGYMSNSDGKYKGTLVFESSTPPTISSNTFSKSFINKIFVPVGASSTYKSATNWSTFADYIVEPNNINVSVPSQLINNPNYTYSIDGTTFNQFTSSLISLENISTIKFKNIDSNTTILIGTSAGASDIGTIANAELTYATSGDQTIYLTIQ